MQVSNLESVLPLSDHIIISLVEQCSSCELWSRKLGQRAEIDSVNDFGDVVQDKACCKGQHPVGLKIGNVKHLEGLPPIRI